MKRRKSTTAGVILAATVSAIVALFATPGALAAPVGGQGRASGGVVLEWNRYALQMFNRLETAMVQGAVYDAVNAIAGTHRPYLAAPQARRWYSQRAAAATAAYRTMVGISPARQPELQPLFERSLAGIPDGAAKRGGITVGEQAAQTMLTARQGDGRNGTRRPVIGTEPGQWRPTPPDHAIAPTAWIGDVRPFLVPSAQDLRTRGPNPLDSTAYATDFEEVKTFGAAASTMRTAEQTDIAKFWDQAPWDPIVASLARGHHLDTAKTARLLAMVYLAAADSQIACVNDKNHWNFWRPVTAIRLAATDGNPATAPDDTWLPLIVTPGFAEHAAGHTCGSAAITGALRNFFGTDAVRFTAASTSSGTTRSFTGLSQALNEVIDSRVLAGVHFRTAQLQGAKLGAKVAQWVAGNHFQPVPIR